MQFHVKDEDEANTLFVAGLHPQLLYAARSALNGALPSIHAVRFKVSQLKGDSDALLALHNVLYKRPGKVRSSLSASQPRSISVMLPDTFFEQP